MSYFHSLDDEPNSFYVLHDAPPNLAGRHVAKNTLPSYTKVRPSTLDSVEFLCTTNNVITAQAINRLKITIEAIRRIWK